MPDLTSRIRCLITGIAGFVGAHLTEHFLRNTDWIIAGIDRLDTSGNLNRLTSMKNWEKFKSRVEFFYHDLKAPLNDFLLNNLNDVEIIFHLAASSHVDRSIADPASFVADNVVGGTNILLFAKELPNLKCFFLFSTDEVFGPAPEGTFFLEDKRHHPCNPYAATKSAQESLVAAFENTYKMPCVITRSMNVIGEKQHPEKFVPLVIKKVLAGEKVLIHTNKEKTKSGSRGYIHARNVADAYLFLTKLLLEYPDHVLGQTFHIVGEKEVTNLDLAMEIAAILKKPLVYELVDFHSLRPGHDLRYALSGARLKNLGWEPPKTFSESLENTVRWYLENPQWL